MEYYFSINSSSFKSQLIVTISFYVALLYFSLVWFLSIIFIRNIFDYDIESHFVSVRKTNI